MCKTYTENLKALLRETKGRLSKCELSPTALVCCGCRPPPSPDWSIESVQSQPKLQWLLTTGINHLILKCNCKCRGPRIWQKQSDFQQRPHSVKGRRRGAQLMVDWSAKVILHGHRLLFFTSSAVTTAWLFGRKWTPSSTSYWTSPVHSKLVVDLVGKL